MRQKLQALLASMNTGLIDREQATKATLLSLLAAENLVLIGPPGTAKSMVARRMAQHIQTSNPAPALPDNSTPAVGLGQPHTDLHDASHYFEYLLTKFSTPEEIFGPLSITELKADRFRRNTAGYLPTAQMAFLDEIFKASSSILNALLTILNERIFHNGNQPQRVPLRSLIAASNELPTGQEELGALYDRFLMRIFVGPVRDDQLHQLFDTPSEAHPATTQLTAHDWQAVDAAAQQVTIAPTVREAIRGIWAAHKEAFKEDRRETLSDRRLVKLLKLLRVSAATNHRTEVDLSDAMLLQHCLWNHPDNLEKVREIVVSTLKRHSRKVPVAGENGVYEVEAGGRQLVQRSTAAGQNPTVQSNRSLSAASLALNTAATLQPARGKTKGFAGSGTAQDPIQINNAEDLVSMDDPDIGLAGYHFVQTADIDCAAISHWPAFAFKGHYNGNGKTIRNVKSKNVFSTLQATSSVTHLRLEKCALAIDVVGSCIEHCHAKGTHLLGATFEKTEITGCQVTGGEIVGRSATNTRMTDCQVAGASLVGNTINASQIARCQVVDGHSLVWGRASESHISDCSVVSKWKDSQGNQLQGLIAATLAQNSVAERCFVAGAIFEKVGVFQFGSIAGQCISSTIRQCAVGLLNVTLRSSGNERRRIVYLTEKVTPFEEFTLQNNASIDSNPGTDIANGRDGKTIAAARFNQRFFEGTLGWDFDTVWRWDTANNRPTLRLNAGTDTAEPTASTVPMQDLLTRQVQANIWL